MHGNMNVNFGLEIGEKLLDIHLRASSKTKV